jgi:hypothetical protein
MNLFSFEIYFVQKYEEVFAGSLTKVLCLPTNGLLFCASSHMIAIGLGKYLDFPFWKCNQITRCCRSVCLSFLLSLSLSLSQPTNVLIGVSRGALSSLCSDDDGRIVSLFS